MIVDVLSDGPAKASEQKHICWKRRFLNLLQEGKPADDVRVLVSLALSMPEVYRLHCTNGVTERKEPDLWSPGFLGVAGDQCTR